MNTYEKKANYTCTDRNRNSIFPLVAVTYFFRRIPFTPVNDSEIIFLVKVSVLYSFLIRHFLSLCWQKFALHFLDGYMILSLAFANSRLSFYKELYFYILIHENLLFTLSRSFSNTFTVFTRKSAYAQKSAAL